MSKRIIKAITAPAPLGDYAQGWEVQNCRVIFISGQVSVDKEGNVVGMGDIAVQTRTSLLNLKRVLEDAGATLQDVVKINTYVTDMAGYRAKTQQIRRECFPRDFPASTLVEVKALARPEFLVEVEAIAAVG